MKCESHEWMLWMNEADIDVSDGQIENLLSIIKDNMSSSVYEINFFFSQKQMSKEYRNYKNSK
jgi:hypothetical protein